jgi:flagellar protein FliT
LISKGPSSKTSSKSHPFAQKFGLINTITKIKIVATNKPAITTGLERYSQLELLTNQMVIAARRGDLDRLAALSEECKQQSDAIEADRVYESLTSDEKRARLRILKAILKNDAEIRKLQDPSMARLENLLKTSNDPCKERQQT